MIKRGMAKRSCPFYCGGVHNSEYFPSSGIIPLAYGEPPKAVEGLFGVSLYCSLLRFLNLYRDSLRRQTRFSAAVACVKQSGGLFKAHLRSKFYLKFWSEMGMGFRPAFDPCLKQLVFRLSYPVAS